LGLFKTAETGICVVDSHLSPTTLSGLSSLGPSTFDACDLPAVSFRFLVFSGEIKRYYRREREIGEREKTSQGEEEKRKFA
jgi:hypothetical protein